MKGISLKMNCLRVAVLAGILVIVGCSSNSTAPPIPSGKYSLSFTSASASLDYTNLDVLVGVPAQAIPDDAYVSLQAQLMPDNLPARGMAGSIHERIGWISLINMGDPTVSLQKELTVNMPLNGVYIANANYAVFKFDPSLGVWTAAGRAATVTDNGSHAIFNIDSFGIWGVFKGVALHIDAKASRTTAKAPASITLTAIIDGGAPPYTVTWWFGDDKDPQMGVAVSHQYENPITYTAACVVLDNAGHEVTDTIDIKLH